MDIDNRELLEFADELVEIVNDYPKEAKKFLKKEARDLRKSTVTEMNRKVGKKTGNLRKGIKMGQVYRYRENDNLSVRVYGGKPAHHAHLIDRGHKIVTPYRWRKKPRKHGGGAVTGRARAFPFFEPAGEKFEDKFREDCQEFLDDLIIGGIGK